MTSPSQAVYDAGASIVHFHGRTADGAPDNSREHYLETIRLVHEACPILVHPSLG